ncbi:hypothetical protein L3Q82_001691 [Scortum barcoo]|uniref:Uncharacterized protein n=1 Tax=Scortum barcoo TaxID=214431 RepID=A0ACB8W482_9TELE|nr:hypothetical protein L3Q82_001691 [Scortum barcoo]
MDPAHTRTSSPESRLERIEQTLRQHEARFAYGSFGDPMQATPAQAAGVAALTSQVQQLMAAFTTATALPPRRLLRLLLRLLFPFRLLLQLRLLLRLLPAPVPEPRVGNLERYAGDPRGLRSVHHELLHPLRSAASDVFIGSEAKVAFAINHLMGRALDFGGLLSGSGGLQPARPSKPSSRSFAKSSANRVNLGPDATGDC